MPARVLIADDEPAITNVMGEALRAAGHEALTAGDGVEALETARRERPDIALLDVMMPRMDGRDVCRRIRDDPEVSDTPVLLFSSIDEPDVHWEEAGADGFLQKPFDILALSDRVERGLAKRSTQ